VVLYAAYGSNMDSAQMAERCPHSPQQGTGWLEGWRLTFGGEELGWEGALATVVEDDAERVFVVLYDVSESDQKALDRWDGVTPRLLPQAHGAGAVPRRRHRGLGVRAERIRGRAALRPVHRHPGRRRGEGSGARRLCRLAAGQAVPVHRFLTGLYRSEQGDHEQQ
jgi:hypothetical protein